MQKTDADAKTGVVREDEGVVEGEGEEDVMDETGAEVDVGFCEGDGGLKGFFLVLLWLWVVLWEEPRCFSGDAREWMD